MAVNLATKYRKELSQPFTRESVIAGRTSEAYDWIGAKTIVLLTVVTQELNDYNRTGENRFGTPTEAQDTKQELTLTKDKSYSITIDRGNYEDQVMAKEAGKVSKAQIKEKVVPFWDKYSIETWATGTTNKSVHATLDKDTVYDAIVEARTAFTNANINVDPTTCTCYLGASSYALLLKNPNFISVEKLAKELLSKGVVGSCAGFLIKEIPDSYLPSNTTMLFTHKDSVIAPRKLHSLYIRNNVQGIDGWVIEGRDYGDAFIVESKKGGVFKVVTSE